MFKIKVNEIIKQRRLELGLTLKDVSKALNVSESTISRYESSEIQNMGIDKIESLSKVLRCSPGYLMGWVAKKESDISEKEKVLLSYYNQLNYLGKDKLIDEAEDLTHNIKYSNVVALTTNPTKEEDKSYLGPIAAHNDNITDEELELIKQDLEDMDNW